jgi:hypothetical protein
MLVASFLVNDTVIAHLALLTFDKLHMRYLLARSLVRSSKLEPLLHRSLSVVVRTISFTHFQTTNSAGAILLCRYGFGKSYFMCPHNIQVVISPIEGYLSARGNRR